MGAVCFQLIHVVLSCDTDHESEFPTRTGLNAGEGILHDDRATWLHTEHLRCLQIRVGSRLAGKMLLRDDIAIDARIEKIAHTGRRQYGLAILAGSHYCGFEAVPSQKLEESN